MIEIPLTQGQVAVVDDESAALVGSHRWHAVRGRGTYYAATNVKGSNGRYRRLTMHALLAQPPAGMEVDHANGNGCDNRRSNLRVCTRRQNGANKERRALGSSRFKGVSLRRPGKWRAYVTVGYRRRYLGDFDTEEAAAVAYNQAAALAFGEFAKLNPVRASR